MNAGLGNNLYKLGFLTPPTMGHFSPMVPQQPTLCHILRIATMCHTPRFRGEAPAGPGFGIPSRSRQLFVTAAVLLGRASDVQGDRGDANRYRGDVISL